MGQMGIGLIGTGRHGARYARHILRDFPDLYLAGIWRRDHEAARQQAEEWNCRQFDDYRELLVAPEVAAVVIVVPPTMHVQLLEAAADAGKAVLLEKPAAASLDDAVAISAAVRRARIPVMVAQTLRFNGVVEAVRAAKECIGRIHAVRISQRFEPSRPGWIDDPGVSGGGVMLHTGVHSFDMLRYLTGLDVVSVQCESARVGTMHTEDNFVANVRMEDPMLLASIAGSRAAGGRNGPIELAGSEGQIVADHVLNFAMVVRGGDVERLTLPEPVQTVRATISAFVQALSTGGKMPIPLYDGLAAVAVVDACYESIRTGGRVVVRTEEILRS